MVQICKNLPDSGMCCLHRTVLGRTPRFVAFGVGDERDSVSQGIDLQERKQLCILCVVQKVKTKTKRRDVPVTMAWTRRETLGRGA